MKNRICATLLVVLCGVAAALPTITHAKTGKKSVSLTATERKMLGRWFCQATWNPPFEMLSFVTIDYRPDRTYQAEEVGQMTYDELTGLWRVGYQGKWSARDDSYQWQMQTVHSPKFDDVLLAINDGELEPNYEPTTVEIQKLDDKNLTYKITERDSESEIATMNCKR
ncbi:hypothetical protein SAMN02745664_11539 [Moraxella cuniculi DSM 21768]|uniref:Lipocalin-like domain-containing protein n=1 Tax=Moraxella cuniculi DSM 21768 TaxID=1122245 RepID=A0A1N7FPD1_9GAMM|nr:hypothetical protein [Moraxella cuniculi]OOS07189.1 hypothetical protein B0189_03950 [Moraxella cuniculi]SIS02160.1 hypothetical protein SAMN02745664_11539 [Moraxella cuniculi DSM 21768]